MKIIGLTGGIGSGKSTILRFFEDLGAAVFVADIEAKKLMNSNQDLKGEIVDLFGEGAYKNGILNREYIASIVFTEKEKLQQLNKLVHPKVREQFAQFSKKCTKDILVYEAAILFESGSANLCDFIVVVTADLEERIARVTKRDHISEEKVRQRIQHQLSDEEKVKKADFVIRNNDLDSAKKQVETIFKLLVEEK